MTAGERERRALLVALAEPENMMRLLPFEAVLLIEAELSRRGPCPEPRRARAQAFVALERHPDDARRAVRRAIGREHARQTRSTSA